MTTNELKTTEEPPADTLCRLLQTRQCAKRDVLWVELLRSVRTERLVHWLTLCCNVRDLRSRMGR